jgi:hypothetical protein
MTVKLQDQFDNIIKIEAKKFELEKAMEKIKEEKNKVMHDEEITNQKIDEATKQLNDEYSKLKGIILEGLSK